MINNTSFFKGLTEEHRRELARIADLMPVKKRGYLFHEGEKGSRMFLQIGRAHV